jgi:hypothetical protein
MLLDAPLAVTSAFKIWVQILPTVQRRSNRACSQRAAGRYADIRVQRSDLANANITEFYPDNNC